MGFCCESEDCKNRIEENDITTKHNTAKLSPGNYTNNFVLIIHTCTIIFCKYFNFKGGLRSVIK